MKMPTCFFADCPYPGKVVDVDAIPALVRYQVTGWEKERKGGGTNAIELRQRTGGIAHAECVERTKRGLSGQTSLL